MRRFLCDFRAYKTSIGLSVCTFEVCVSRMNRCGSEEEEEKDGEEHRKELLRGLGGV